MWHTIFIALHATTATIALVAGLLALPAGRFFAVYRWALAGMAVFLVAALVVGWSGNEVVTNVIFAALLILAAVMLYRARLAGRLLPASTGGPTATYVNHVGFTLVSLTAAFVVVAVLRAGAPDWLLAVSAVAVGAVGHVALGAARAHLVSDAARDRAPAP